jgi:(R,R)-butanediol dehydrogenase/meso-butanediol dehydrogenase/diacetyl reductase
MRAAVFHDREDVRVEEVPEPVAGPGEVKLKVAYNGICGTDLHEFVAGPLLIPTSEPHPRTGATAPLVMGHEFSGEVVEVGDGVDDVAIGARVAAEPYRPCGECRYCERGSYNLCATIAFQGCNTGDGGLAEYTLVEARQVHPLPDEVGLDLGALVEPLSVSHHSVGRADPGPDDLVVVYGGGPIGLGAFLDLRARGIGRIVMVEPAADRATVLRNLGAEDVVDPTAIDVVEHVREIGGGYGADISIDTAGTASSFQAAVDGTARLGTILLVATFPAPVSLQPNDLVLNERKILTSAAYLGPDFDAVIEGFRRGDYPTDGWVEKIPLDRVVEDGFKALRDSTAIKILVDPQPVAAG